MLDATQRWWRRGWYVLAERWRCSNRWVATPVRDLPGHALFGGHTVARHVEIDVAALRNRLVDEGLQQASRFWDARIAQAAVNYAVSHEFEGVVRWLLKGPLRRFTLTVPAPRRICVGFGVSSGRPGFDYPRHIRVVLERNGATFFVVTAYPHA